MSMLKQNKVKTVTVYLFVVLVVRWMRRRITNIRELNWSDIYLFFWDWQKSRTQTCFSLSDTIHRDPELCGEVFRKTDGDELKKVPTSGMKEHFENNGAIWRDANAGREKLQLRCPGRTKYASVRDCTENAAIFCCQVGMKAELGGIKNDP